jgi:lipoate synthase
MTKIYIKKDTSFPITSVSRDDLIDAGFDASDVSDDIMTELASKMANAYVENTFWIDLGIIAEDLGVKKFNDN